MHIVTFYSYKGGVGRTFALVNTAWELASRGRNVLIVDFDLEAPGLDTFPAMLVSDPKPGIVDFVTSYKETGGAPDVRSYVSELPHATSGRLWLMRAGTRDSLYARRLGEIDWYHLYSERDGYLLIEDLKEQWREAFAPDYVLIDARTGHNDVAGICTRQLPDAVVVLFFPNEQNLSGLERIVQEIRAEGTGPRQHSVQLHFVMSNVPDLDDEDRILAQRLDEFKVRLGFRDLSLSIHHYNSLSLLNQVIFTQEKPRSRLAKEYRLLADRLIESNLQDREGALRFVNTVRDRSDRILGELSSKEIEDRLEQIAIEFQEDGEVQYRLAVIKMARGEFEEALRLLNFAMSRGFVTPEAFLRRADCKRIIGDDAGALSDAEQLLQRRDAKSHEVLRAVRMLRAAKKLQPDLIAYAPAVSALPAAQRSDIATDLRHNTSELAASRKIFETILQSDPTGEVAAHTQAELAVTLIGLRLFRESLHLLRPLLERDRASLPVAPLFNSAMAEWAASGQPPLNRFRHVVEIGSNVSMISPNYWQCLAVAHWACGDRAAALAALERSRNQAKAGRAEIFTCWRYQLVPRARFFEDLDSIEAMANGRSVLPLFITGVSDSISPDSREA